MEAPLLARRKGPHVGRSRAILVASVASLAVLAFVAAVAVTRGAAPVSLVGLVSSMPQQARCPTPLPYDHLAQAGGAGDQVDHVPQVGDQADHVPPTSTQVSLWEAFLNRLPEAIRNRLTSTSFGFFPSDTPKREGVSKIPSRISTCSPQPRDKRDSDVA